jgi:hypothetical protein
MLIESADLSVGRCRIGSLLILAGGRAPFWLDLNGMNRYWPGFAQRAARRLSENLLRSRPALHRFMIVIRHSRRRRCEKPESRQRFTPLSANGAARSASVASGRSELITAPRSLEITAVTTHSSLLVSSPFLGNSRTTHVSRASVVPKPIRAG